MIAAQDWPERFNFSESVIRRRSKRNFVRKEINSDQLRALTDALCADSDEMPGDSVRTRSSVCSGFICGDVKGVKAGVYLIDPEVRSVALLEKGLFLDDMALICLNQAWLANAAVHFLFLADLRLLQKIWGARGYRYAMIQAGRMGERLYLAATAMGLGCCGIGAFYDLEAVERLGLDAHTRLLYLVGVGAVKS